MIKLKKGDTVVVTAGKDRGKRGTVERVIADRGAVISGVNIYKRHTRSRGQNQPGGIIEFPRPLAFGNVALLCPRCQKPTRVGFMIKDKKVRVCRKCDEVIG